MPFNPESAKAAGQKSKRGPSKLLDPNIKEKMEILYEGVLDDLIIHQKELSMSERIKLVQIISNYILPKSKPVRDDITLEKRQGLKVGCLEEIAFEKGFITKEKLLEGAEKMEQTEYGSYLMKKYSDKP